MRLALCLSLALLLGGTDVRAEDAPPICFEIAYATYLGGGGEELIRGLALGNDGSVDLVGKTHSKDFPTTNGVIQRGHGGDADALVVRLRPRD